MVQAAGQAHRWMQRDVGHTAFAGMTRGKLLVGTSAKRVRECSWQREDALRRARSWHVEGAGRPGCLKQRDQEESSRRGGQRRGGPTSCRAVRIVRYALALIWHLRSLWRVWSQRVISDVHFKVTVVAVLSLQK